MDHTNHIIGLGTAAIGRPQYINIRQGRSSPMHISDFKKEGLRTLENAYQQGIRYFDTAPGYGLAEQLLIDWIQSKNDPAIRIGTKWGYTYIANFDPKATEHEVKEHSLAKLNEQWAASKALLPYLKIYQIHSATFESKVLENEAIIQKLFELKQKHRLQIGITTTGDNQIDVIEKALDIKTKNQDLFDTFQITYNILDQSTANVIAILNKKNKKTIIKEVLANGRLFPNSNYAQYQKLYKLLLLLAKKYKVGIDAIALRFCMDTVNPYKVLSGASNPNHITENLKVTQFQLTTEDILRLQSFKVAPKTYWEERKKLTWN